MNVSDPFLQLTRLMAPQGIKTVTTGAGEVAEFVKARYGSQETNEIQSRWLKILEGVATAKVIVLGVPMDAGAGFERGAFKGPVGIRTQLLSKPGLYDLLNERGVVDIGDVFVNPSLLSDGLLNEGAIQKVRAARNSSDFGHDHDLPVSPHSAFERALECIRAINPKAKIHLLGGDHSLSWVPFRVLTRDYRNLDCDLGIIHFDAHTDLLRDRDGIEESFATWAYHANEAIGRGQRLQQFGIRVSGRTKEYWESTLNLRQFRDHEIPKDGSWTGLIENVVNHFVTTGVRRVYISNDIDGTDPRYCAATGTMELNGMLPHFVDALIQAVGGVFEVVGADMMEVAPPLKTHVPDEPRRTLQMAAFYTMGHINAMLRPEDRFENPFQIPTPCNPAQLKMPRYA